MIRSMTSFARGGRTEDGIELVWELRSVNHRYLEIQPRLPEDFRQLDAAVREAVARRLGRGKVECGLRYRADGANIAAISLNEPMLDQLLGAMEAIRNRESLLRESDIMAVLAWPGVTVARAADLTPVQAQAMALLETVLDDLVATREREGARLAALIESRCELLQAQVDKARQRMPVVIEAVRERLRNRLAEVAENLDEQRLEQEMALLAQRLDVDEEMDRLSTHLQEVRDVLKRDEPVGRRLDFLMQELNREANTLGSKSADSESTAISVEMKVLIEQMREQVQNIE
ncbi:YicC/YloC family endoribonuclease [Thiolapillus sp.]|uniref:YicC/YloC family endoribonuclease n=1 Tax=Thiolapillus sp. TaxID=2017437 RepID=UPI003AF9E11A